MQRYLFRVAYTYADGATPIAGITVAYEPTCVRAEDEASARAAVLAATTRYLTAVGATKTVTLILTTADV